jgi:glucuronate isomerase
MAWARIMPDLIGNPLYQWTHLELQRYFNVDQPLNSESASLIWKKVNDYLSKPDFYPVQLLRNMNVKILCTTDDPVSTLSDHESLMGKTGDMQVIPASRPDRFLRLLNPDYPDVIQELAQSWGSMQQKITHLDDLASALRARASYFHDHGCRLSDHALDHMPVRPPSRNTADQLFQKRLDGQALTPVEAAQVQFAILIDLASIYHDFGWTMQLHIGALRNTNSCQFDAMGPDTGFDAIDDEPIAKPLAQLLDAMEQGSGLPRTLLYSLNAKDNMTLNTIASTFPRDGKTAWVSAGPAWWFHDQLDGMELHLQQYCQAGVLPTFVGMSTDSRSLLSYTRHEYFRRIFCNVLGRWVESGQYPLDWKALSSMVERVCWKNASSLFA